MQKVYETERLVLKVLDGSYADPTLDFYKRNRSFFREWDPARGEDFYTKKSQQETLDADLREIEDHRMLRLWIFKKGDESRIIGFIVFNTIIRGVFLSCFLGYKLDQCEINQGYTTEAVQKGIDVIFHEFGLHRIEANIMPRNKRSLRVAEKLGFYHEGLARQYLKINGKWEDHIHMVLLNERL